MTFWGRALLATASVLLNNKDHAYQYVLLDLHFAYSALFFMAVLLANSSIPAHGTN